MTKQVVWNPYNILLFLIASIHTYIHLLNTRRDIPPIINHFFTSIYLPITYISIRIRNVHPYIDLSSTTTI